MPNLEGDVAESSDLRDHFYSCDWASQQPNSQKARKFENFLQENFTHQMVELKVPLGSFDLNGDYSNQGTIL